MKLILTTLATFFLASQASAAVASDAELKCNYVVATSLLENWPGASNSQVLPAEVRGEIILKKEGSSYKAELPIDPKALVIYFDATIEDATGLSLSIKVVETRYNGPNILVSTTSMHTQDNTGAYRGSQVVRNPAVENIAVKNNISFGDAALSENLPTGLSFVGAMINCN